MNWLCGRVSALVVTPVHVAITPATSTLAPGCTGVCKPASRAVISQVRTKMYRYIEVPEPGGGRQFRYRVDLPKQYTVRPLPTIKLAGRDPLTGRVVVGTLGGGSKQNYRWVDECRRPLSDGSARREQIVSINYDPLRSCMLACVAHADKLRYILAHSEACVGDIVTTYGDIPRVQIRGQSGDSHPLGALSPGTMVHNIEIFLGEPQRMCINGGTYATIVRKAGDRVIVQLVCKKQFSFRQECMCTVGSVMARYPAIRPIGSAQRLRHLGYRPRSGLEQKKTGRFGRKVKPLPALRQFDRPPADSESRATCTPLELHVRDRDVPDFKYGRLFPDPQPGNQLPW